MGLGNREGGKYITILNGKFCVRVEAGTPGAKERVNKVGKTVHEVFYDSFTGKLVNIRTRDGEYGKTWEFDFRDKEDVYTLQLSYSNSYATNFLKMLPNVDLTKEMKVQPSQKIEDGKTKSSLFISQDGKTLKHAYTKDNPNGLPPMVQIMVKGKETWDDTDRLKFLEAMVNRDILPKLPRDTAGTSAPASKEDASDEAFGTPGGEDDF
jgi:hypothetical protein